MSPFAHAAMNLLVTSTMPGRLDRGAPAVTSLADLAARAARQLPARGRRPAHRFGDQVEWQLEDVV